MRTLDTKGMTEDLTVAASGDRSTFYVQSANNPDGYLVDMAALHGNGFCNCRDFQCRCEPTYVREHKIVHFGRISRTQCKHINAVLLYLGDLVAKNMASDSAK